MNGDDDDVHGKDLMTPVELLHAATLGCIEMLRRKQVCFYPGSPQPVGPGAIGDFGQ
jgi:hypothetical protein